MDHKFEGRWPHIQRSIESIPLSMPYQFRPLRLMRHFLQRFISYQPGIYIFAYHLVINPAKTRDWEIAYNKGCVSLEHFERQIAFLRRKMTPISLTEAFEMETCRSFDRPYFVITFDDGYSNLFNNAAPVLARFGVKPCVFVNGRFAQGYVHFRVLAALLIKTGHVPELKEELVSRDGNIAWSSEPQELFRQTKECYIAGVIEDSVEAAYHRCIGNPASLNVHLKPMEVHQLQSAGWEVGNHTYDHRLLSQLSLHQIDNTISRNEVYWRNENVRLINALAVPNGAVRDVSENLYMWLQEHNKVHAIFGNGGVNFKFDRTQWLRLFAGSGDEFSLHETICAETKRMNMVWKQIEDRKR